MAAVAMFDEAQTPTLVLAARALEDALFGWDPRRLSGEDAAKGVEVLARTIKICTAKKAQLAARAAECGEHKKRGHVRPAEWLARQNGTTTGEARRDLDLATKLQDHPETKDALEKGEVSLDEAEEAIKTDEECPGSEGEILNEARDKGLGAARDKGRRRRQAAQDIDELERKRWKARSLRAWTDDLGMVNVLATLLPEAGARVLSKLEAEAQREWKRGNRESTLDQRMHDAFLVMLEGKGRGPTTRPEVVMVWNLNDDTARIPAQGPVTMQSVFDLAKQAVITVVLHDGVKVDTIKRYSRAWPPELRTLFDIGAPPDFDGAVCSRCHKRFRLQKDHLDPKNNGGSTSWENLNPVCPPCHDEKTEEDREAGLLGPEARAEAEERRREAEGRGPP